MVFSFGRPAGRLGLAAVIAAMVLPHVASADDKVRLGVLRLGSQAPFFVGLEEGRFAEAGIDAELVFFDAAVPATIAIASGDVDVAVIGFTQAFFNLAAENQIVAVSGHSREIAGFQNTGFFVSRAAYDRGLDSIDKMQGASIGLTTIGSTNHYAVERIAEKHGIDLAQSRLVPAQGLGNLAAMVQGGQVDIAAGAATGFMPLVESGAAHVLAWAGDEVPFQLAGLGVSPRMIAERRDVLERVIDVYEDGAREYQEVLLDQAEDGSFRNPERAQEMIAIVARYTGMPEDAVSSALSYIDPRIDVQSVIDIVEWNKAQGMIDQSVAPARFLDLSFVEGHDNVPAGFAGAD
ncbi:ABC transporter substrate-binding protein [Halodurantibacterium flavum]|uniref:ABC transporter substrate-binding protein n=1 Tax=Halodurantibacterium flavum TaxID=1382802 RepID=A0ABW4S0I7_9RHOB